MTNTEIIRSLKANETQLLTFFAQQPVAFWKVQPTGKWTAGQHVIHLVQSTTPLLKALKMPNFILKWKFGKSNRPSRSYEEVIQKYQTKLKAAGPGVVGPFSLNMPDSPPSEADMWLTKLSDLNSKINDITKKLSDNELDTILLPHPLMGKMTLREILMWNGYHIQHHLEILKTNYKI
jgi:DinB superfamily